MADVFREILASQLERAGQDRVALSALDGAWTELTGATVARHTSPIAWRDGALVVGVDSEAWLDQLRSQRERFRRRLVAVLPGDFRLAFEHAPDAGRADAGGAETESAADPAGPDAAPERDDLDDEILSILDRLDDEIARSLLRIRRESSDDPT